MKKIKFLNIASMSFFATCFLLVQNTYALNDWASKIINVPDKEKLILEVQSNEKIRFHLLDKNAPDNIYTGLFGKFTSTYGVVQGNNNVETFLKDSNALLTPPTQDAYDIKISGKIYGSDIVWDKNNNNIQSNLQDHVKDIKQWGKVDYIDLTRFFAKPVQDGKCIDGSDFIASYTDAPNLRYVLSMKEMFMNAQKFNGSMKGWKTPRVQDMSGMFYCAMDFNQAVSDFTTDKVKNMSQMFRSAESFNQSVDSWNVANVQNMSQMFYNAKKFNKNINSWDTSSVTDMHAMFFGANDFNGDISNWNTQNVTDMSQMFENAKSFDQDISAWKIDSITSMENMFAGAKLSTKNYDKLLISLYKQAEKLDKQNIKFHGGNSAYCLPEAKIARQQLINTYKWEINDAGENCTSIELTPIKDFSIPENTTKIEKIVVDKGNLDTYTFEMVAGNGDADNDFFEFSHDGVLRFKNAPDFEKPSDADGDNIYTIRVKVTNTKSESLEKELRITVTNKEESVITLTINGNSLEKIELGSEYKDKGATCVSSLGLCDIIVTGDTVNTKISGKYTITYTAKDSTGNQLQKSRVVIVQDTSKRGSGFTPKMHNNGNYKGGPNYRGESDYLKNKKLSEKDIIVSPEKKNNLLDTQKSLLLEKNLEQNEKNFGLIYKGKSYRVKNNFETCPLINHIQDDNYGNQSIKKFTDTRDSVISKFASLGIIDGYKDNTFKPYKKISRGEFTKILLLTHCYDYKNLEGKTIYTDITKNTWKAKIVQKATQLGIVNGYDDGTFRFDDTISRAEAIKILMNISMIELQNTQSQDFGKNWYKKYAHIAETLEIIDPEDKHFFSLPNNGVSRSELVYFVNTLAKRYK